MSNTCDKHKVFLLPGVKCPACAKERAIHPVRRKKTIIPEDREPLPLQDDATLDTCHPDYQTT